MKVRIESIAAEYYEYSVLCTECKCKPGMVRIPTRFLTKCLTKCEFYIHQSEFNESIITKQEITRNRNTRVKKVSQVVLSITSKPDTSLVRLVCLTNTFSLRQRKK